MIWIIIPAILACSTATTSPTDYLRLTHDRIQADGETLRIAGIRWSYVERTDFLSEINEASARRIEGEDVLWGDWFFNRRVIFPRGSDQSSTTLFESFFEDEYRIMHRNQRLERGEVELPPGAHVPVLDGRIEALPPTRLPGFLPYKHPIDVLSLVDPDEWLTAWAGYPLESAESRREGTIMPAVESAMQIDGNLVIVTSWFEDPTITGAVNDTVLTFSAECTVTLDLSIEGMLVAFELSRFGSVFRAGEFSWHPLDRDGKRVWMLVRSYVYKPSLLEAGPCLGTTYTVDVGSIQIGPPASQDMRVKFPPDTEVWDALRQENYVVSTTANGQDRLDNTYEAILDTFRSSRETVDVQTEAPPGSTNGFRLSWKLPTAMLAGLVLILFSAVYAHVTTRRNRSS